MAVNRIRVKRCISTVGDQPELLTDTETGEIKKSISLRPLSESAV